MYLIGCNLYCPFCTLKVCSREEEWIISQTLDPRLAWNPPIDQLLPFIQKKNIKSIVISGGEPIIHPEYIERVWRFAASHNIFIELATNGYMTEKIARRISKIVDYPVIGLKGSGSPQLYAQMNADPQNVLNTIKVFGENNRNLVLSDLVDPCLGDTFKDAEKLARWMTNNITAEISVILSSQHNPIGPLHSPAVGSNTIIPISGVTAATKHMNRIAETMRKNGVRNVYYQNLKEVDPEYGIHPWIKHKKQVV